MDQDSPLPERLRWISDELHHRLREAAALLEEEARTQDEPPIGPAGARGDLRRCTAEIALLRGELDRALAEAAGG